MDNFDNVQIVKQPKNYKTNLYRHQLASIYNMEKLEREQKIQDSENKFRDTNVGLLGDETGYGKTISMIGLICRNKREWDLNSQYTFENISSYSGGRIKTHTIKKYGKMKTTLILMSKSIVNQWKTELMKTTLNIITIVTNKDIEKDASEYDVVIITPNLFNKYVSKYNNIAWKRFIFDEPGHIKVPRMSSVIAGFYWLITATPQSIYTQHKLCRSSFMIELMCINNWYSFDTFFDGMIIKNNINFIKESYQMPPTQFIYHECYQPLCNVINGFVSREIQTMIEAGNIEGVILSLGGGKTQNVVELVKRKKLEELEEIEAKIRIYTIREDTTRIEEWTTRKNHVTLQLDEITSRFEHMLQSDCAICSCELKSPVLEPKCQNLFCGECLFKWLKNSHTCPLCRSDINTKDLIYVDTGKKKHEECNIIKKMTKLEKILSLIKEKPDGKFLIFSLYDNSFNSISAMLNENNISNSQIKGNIKKIEDTIEDFKKGKLKVIFINTIFNGSGLNLQETTDIILLHNMSEYDLNQIVGRANRIGRSLPLTVHCLEVQI
jgi:superfamily II DNA or RNA helicase